MERIRKTLERIKSSPLTLDKAFSRFFGMGSESLRDFHGTLEDVMSARVAMHLRDDRGCINQEHVQDGFGKIASVIKNCPEKPKMKGTKNADTGGQRRRSGA